MFDRYVLGPRSMDVSVRHTEERAPTDDSVKLLREMEAAARTSVVESMRLKNNEVEAIVHRHDSPMDMVTYYKIHYAINGKHREVEMCVDGNAPIKDNLQIIWDALARDIASFILGSNIKSFVKK